jgi:NADPH2:quinone reductase
MRALIVSAVGPTPKADLAVTADPELSAGQVLIEVHAVPVNYVDLVTLAGRYQFAPQLPYIPGKGPAGIVRAVTEGVTGLAVGDRVLAMAEYGGYAQLAAVAANQVYRLPPALSFADAATMSLAFDTAWMALRDRARLAAGESVLVLGATGAVGGAAIQLAKAMGAGTVLAGVSRPDRYPTLAAMGADAMVDLSRPEPRESIREQVYASTGSQGVDIVIDPLGGDMFDGALRALAWRGRLVVVGFAAGRIPTLKANYLLLKNIEVSGLQISDYRKRRPELMTDCYRELFSYYDAGSITPPARTLLPLSEWREALRLVEDRSVPGRVVLLPQA